MPKKPSSYRIKKHRVYIVWEVAEVLGVHKQTVIRWVKDKGLKADVTCKPWLIRGSDLKVFLGERRANGRCKLALHQMYCLPCHLPQTPDGLIADYQHGADQNGNLIGLCPECGRLMNKFIRRDELEAIRAKLDVTVRQTDPRLLSPSTPSVTVTLEGSGEDHVKAPIK